MRQVKVMLFNGVVSAEISWMRRKRTKLRWWPI